VREGMPRTREQLRKALADTEAWLNSLDPKALALPESDAADLRAIGDALQHVATEPRPARPSGFGRKADSDRCGGAVLDGVSDLSGAVGSGEPGDEV
jgi:hypothetical protein